MDEMLLQPGSFVFLSFPSNFPTSVAGEAKSICEAKRTNPLLFRGVKKPFERCMNTGYREAVSSLEKSHAVFAVVEHIRHDTVADEWILDESQIFRQRKVPVFIYLWELDKQKPPPDVGYRSIAPLREVVLVKQVVSPTAWLEHFRSDFRMLWD